MLDYSDLLIVPGGWASDKTAALRQEGRDAVREFVRNGGSYLGICGGAGFALDTRDGLGLRQRESESRPRRGYPPSAER